MKESNVRGWARREAFKVSAEQATGLRATGAPLTPLFRGRDVSMDEAGARFAAGLAVVFPDAGPASMYEVAELLGLPEIEPEDTTSSAGDWVWRCANGRFIEQHQSICGGFRYKYADRTT